MANKISLNLKGKKPLQLIDKLNFSHILFLWLIIIIAFGIVYFYASSNFGNLLLVKDNAVTNDIFDSIYFSFVSATTTGFGDIIPNGFFRIISIIEVIFGLLLIALVTSKLVSIKQEAILNEVYEISFNEKLMRLRSSMLLFRQNIDRSISKIEEGTVKKRDFIYTLAQFTEFEDSINEIFVLINKRNNLFLKKLDSVNTELILNSLLSSLDKMVEFCSISNLKSLKYKNNAVEKSVSNSILIVDTIFSKIDSLSLTKQTADDLVLRKNKVILELKTQ